MASMGVVLLVVVLLGAVAAVHHVYFRIHFPRDTRYRLPGMEVAPSDVHQDEHVFIDVIRSVVTCIARDTTSRGALAGHVDEARAFMAMPSRPAGGKGARQQEPVEHVARHAIALTAPGEVRERYLASLESISITHGRVQAGAIIARHSIMIRSSSLFVSCIESRNVRINLEEEEASASPPLMPLAEASACRRRDVPVLHVKTFVPQVAVVERDLVCMKDLVVERPATFLGDVKVNGNLHVQAPVVFHGVVVVNGDVDARAECWFLAGSLVKGRVVASNNLRVGHPEQGPAALVAEEVSLQNGLAAHGCIRALKGRGIRLGMQAEA